MAIAAVGLLVPVLLLWVLSRLHPLISLVIGLALLAVPVAGWVMLDQQFGLGRVNEGFAGVVMVVVYGLYVMVSVVCGALGVVFAADGVVRWRRGEVVSPSRRRAALAVGAAVGVALAAHASWRANHAPPVAKRVKAAVSIEDFEVKRIVTVAGSYPLAWNARDGSPPFALTIPAADLQGGPRVAETRDGPSWLRLYLPAAGFGLTLYRGESSVDERVLAWLDAGADPDDPRLPRMIQDPAKPRALWIDRGGGGWRLLGLDCGPATGGSHPAIATGEAGVRCFVPDNGLARYFPFAFHLERVRIDVADDLDRRSCTIAFRFRGRVAQVDSRGPCLAEKSVASLREGVALLDRLARGELDKRGAQ